MNKQTVMICPKPSCNGQRLLKPTGKDNYICVACQCEYVIDEDGKPALLKPMVKPKKK